MEGDDEGIWWTHLHGGCCGTEKQILRTKTLPGVKSAAAYAASLLRGCREEWRLKMIIKVIKSKLTGGCNQVNAEPRLVSVGLSSNVNSLLVILQHK